MITCDLPQESLQLCILISSTYLPTINFQYLKTPSHSVRDPGFGPKLRRTQEQAFEGPIGPLFGYMVVYTAPNNLYEQALLRNMNIIIRSNYIYLPKSILCHYSTLGVAVYKITYLLFKWVLKLVLNLARGKVVYKELMAILLNLHILHILASVAYFCIFLHNFAYFCIFCIFPDISYIFVLYIFKYFQILYFFAYFQLLHISAYFFCI